MAVLARNGLSKSEAFMMTTYVYVSGGKKCAFSGKFGVLCFLVTSVLRFAILPYLLRLFRLTLIIEF